MFNMSVGVTSESLYFIHSIKEKHAKHKTAENSLKVVKSWVYSSLGLQPLKVPVLREFFEHLPGFGYHRAQLS